jgi:Tol biopolymer transport system component
MEAERVRAQLQRILVSSAFANAERGRKFLRFVVEAALDGRAGEIKEYVIGVDALGRSPSFDPKTDPIVRVEAGRLRARLNSFYQSESKRDAVLISLPKGSYVPEFSEHHLPSSSGKTKHPAVLLFGGALLGLVVSALLFFYFRRAPETRDTLRLSIIPPRGAVIEQSAISPDGKQIAFSAVAAGKLQLWLRALDSLEAKALPGTEEGTYPFWSPDGRSLGFLARTTLKRIDTSGGPAQPLCQVGPFRGGTWGSAGVIVFDPRPSGVLYQIPSGGGAPKPATSLDTTRGEIVHEFPQFLPDGRHFLYFAVSSRPGESSIRVGSLDSNDSKFLVNSEASGAYSPKPPEQKGSLLFVYGGALLAQRFDPQKLELSGGRVVVAQEILQKIGKADFSISANGVLAYRAGTQANRQLAWFDREGRRLESVGQPNDYYVWNLSPDGKHLAVMATDPSGAGSSVWILDAASGAPSRLTDISEFAGFPVWSPNGNEVLFSLGDVQAMGLQLQPLNGRSSESVLKSEGPKFLSDWSSNGQYVAYFTPWPEWNKLNIFIAEISGPNKGNEPRHPWPSQYSESSAYFSPSAAGAGPRWIAYTSDETGRDEVYVRNFPAGNRKWLVSTGGGWQPHWRADGRELFYLSPEQTLMAVGVKDGAEFQAGSPYPLFPTAIPPYEGPPELPANGYAASRDGRRFLVNGTVDGTSAPPITIVTHWQSGLP